MVVAALWSLILLLDLLMRFDRARLKLLVFMLTATGLYAMHWMFFNRQTHYTVFCDTVYTFCNLAVFPLYYTYVNHLTDSTSRHRRGWILVLPAVVMATLVGVTYGLMQRNEIQQFVEGFLYNFSLANDFTGITRWQALLHVAVKVIFALEALAVGVASFIKVHRYRHFEHAVVEGVHTRIERTQIEGEIDDTVLAHLAALHGAAILVNPPFITVNRDVVGKVLLTGHDEEVRDDL